LNLLKLDYVKKITLVFVLLMILLFSSSFIVDVILEGKIVHFSALLTCILLLPAIIIKPIRGLILLPIASYILPTTLKYNGISLGLALAAITIFSSLIYIISGKSKPSISWVWIPIILMFTIMFGFSGNDYSSILSFIQGITPFLIFCLVVKDENEGRLILKYWLASFAIFALFHILKGGLLFSDDSIIQGLASVRSQQLGGHNPNVLGWTSLLYIAIAAPIALSSTSIKNKINWWIVFGGILLLIVFSFSRAAILGLLSTLLLLFILIGSNQKKYTKLLVPSIISVFILFFSWSLAVELGVMPSDRNISYDSISPEVGLRTAMIIGGWSLIFENPWGYGPNINYASHSAFTKAALEYGIFYFILFCLPFIYLLWKSYNVSKRLKDQKIKLILVGIFTAGMVSIPQSMFGITMFSSGYAQVFWLFLGYVHITDKIK
jgi:hypothetical protein